MFNKIRARGLRLARSLRQRLKHRLHDPHRCSWKARDAAFRALAAAEPPAGEPPLFGLILRVGPGETDAALRTLDSLRGQNSSGWCLRVLAAPAEEAALQSQFPASPSIVYIPSPLTAGQLAAEQGSGYAALLAAGDTLHPLTLWMIGRELQRQPCDFLYTDEEHAPAGGEKPVVRLKPDWSPDLLLGWNYPGRLAFFALQRLAAMPETPFELEAAHRLALGLLAAPVNVRHLPYALITCRPSPPQSDPHAVQAAVNPARLEAVDGLSRVHFQPAGQPLISILICARDRADLTSRCLDSLFSRTTYPNFEVVLVDNDSQQPEALELYRGWAEKEARFRCERMAAPFNFAALNNRAADLARGSLLLFLNNDTEVLTPTWLEELAGFAQRPSTGCCAPMLLFPDGSIQHAGILAGGGRVVHAWYRADPHQPGTLGRLQVPSNFSALTAACLMLTRERFEAAGGFDEALGIAYNDVDLCFKLRQKGCFNVLLPHIRLYHHESASRGYEDTPERRARRRHEFDLLLQRWPQIAQGDPCAHPCLEALSGALDG